MQRKPVLVVEPPVACMLSENERKPRTTKTPLMTGLIVCTSRARLKKNADGIL